MAFHEQENYLKSILYNLIQTNSQLFEFIQSGSLDGICYWDLENIENVWMNPKFWETLGYDPSEKKHLSSEWQDIIFISDLKNAVENFTKHSEDANYLYDQVVRYRHKNGSTVWIRCKGIAIRDENGKPILMLGAHKDVTERKQYEEALSRNEQYLRTILDTTRDGLWIVDEHGKLEDVNDAYCQMSGYKRDELLTMHVSDLDVLDSIDVIQSKIQRLIVNGSDIFETQHSRKDGSIYDIEISASVLSEKPLRLLSFCRDITAKNQRTHEIIKNLDLLNKVGDLAQIGAWEINLNDNSVWWSDRGH